MLSSLCDDSHRGVRNKIDSRLSGVRSIVFSLVGSFLLFGCAAPPAPEPVVQEDVARVALQKLIVEVDSATSHSASADVRARPAVLEGDRITVRSYFGDAQNLLSRLAKARGMRFLVTGPEPRLPLFVTVDVDGVAFDDFLSQVSHQFGQRADIVLGEEVVEIRYRGQP